MGNRKKVGGIGKEDKGRKKDTSPKGEKIIIIIIIIIITNTRGENDNERNKMVKRI